MERNPFFTFAFLLLLCQPAADSEDDELGGLERREADEYYESAVINVILSHRLLFAPDEE